MGHRTDSELAAVVKAANAIADEEFEVYGGGWKNEISTALLDAVYSIRAVYRSDHPGVGVFGRLQTFRSDHESVTDDLSRLASLDVEVVDGIMGNTRSSQRRKSEIVKEVAQRFVDEGVSSASDFTSRDIAEMKRIYTSVKGIGWITFEYFAMLLGVPGVKADTMIVRFVNRALEAEELPPVDTRRARELVVSAYEETGRGATLTHFDHAIWRAESDLARE